MNERARKVLTGEHCLLLHASHRRWLLVARRLSVSRGVSVAHHRMGLAVRAFSAWRELMAARRLKVRRVWSMTPNFAKVLATV